MTTTPVSHRHKAPLTTKRSPAASTDACALGEGTWRSLISNHFTLRASKSRGSLYGANPRTPGPSRCPFPAPRAPNASSPSRHSYSVTLSLLGWNWGQLGNRLGMWRRDRPCVSCMQSERPTRCAPLRPRQLFPVKAVRWGPARVLPNAASPASTPAGTRHSWELPLKARALTPSGSALVRFRFRKDSDWLVAHARSGGSSREIFLQLLLVNTMSRPSAGAAFEVARRPLPPPDAEVELWGCFGLLAGAACWCDGQGGRRSTGGTVEPVNQKYFFACLFVLGHTRPRSGVLAILGPKVENTLSEKSMHDT